MQDKYAGDLGDFGKYGLLNEIFRQSKDKIRLGINWFYATREEAGNSDGNHIAYLSIENKNASRYRKCFPELYENLRMIVQRDRSVAEIERSNVLPKETLFYSKPVPYMGATASNRIQQREAWFSDSLSQLNKADIVFLDPDNGIQLDASRKAQANAIKYVFTDEIQSYYQLGKSLIIYNHRDRRPRAEYEKKILNNRAYINSWDDIEVLRFKRVSVRDFIFLIQENHRDLITRTIECLTSPPCGFLFKKYPIREDTVMIQRKKYWTNPSVLGLAGDSDPIDTIVKKTRAIVLRALEEGWQGPPFDPFELAQHLKVETVPSTGVFDARTLPIASNRLKIEYNPDKPPARLRFSLAHELAHTLFPDCAESIRNRAQLIEARSDAWQVELLCNISAAEFLMPTGTGIDLELERVTIDNILRLQNQYKVSTEAIALRLAKLTSEPCTVFVAARASDDKEASYHIDYSVPSRTSVLSISRDFKVPKKTKLSECVAIGFTAKSSEQWPPLPRIDVECVGIPPYPGRHWPRIVGVAHTQIPSQPKTLRIKYLYGNALKPRGTAPHIIAHIVNDKTPNWGAGFPVALKRKWPSVQNDFRNWAKSNPRNLSLGQIHVTTISDDISVVHMIAQHGYGPSRKPRIRYASLKECLDKLVNIALNQSASVHMPRIGTGQAGGSWAVVADLIDESLIKQNVEVTVYDLPTSVPSRHTQSPLRLF